LESQVNCIQSREKGFQCQLNTSFFVKGGCGDLAFDPHLPENLEGPVYISCDEDLVSSSKDGFIKKCCPADKEFDPASLLCVIRYEP